MKLSLPILIHALALVSFTKPSAGISDTSLQYLIRSHAQDSRNTSVEAGHEHAHVREGKPHEEHSNAHHVEETEDHVHHGDPDEEHQEVSHEGHAQDGHKHLSHHVGGHGHEGTENNDDVAASLALMLLGTVGWVMSLFYFVNYPDEQVKQDTWDTLSTMIAIFCAVLIFASSSAILIDFAGEEVHHGPPGFYNLLCAFLRFGVFLLTMQLIFYYFRTTHKRLMYCTSLGCHVVGFAAIDAFGNTLQLEFVSSSMLITFGGILLSVVVLLVLFNLLGQLRSRVQGCEEWKEECDEADADSVALAVGLLLSMLIRFAITGHLPPVHGAPKYKTTFEVVALFAVSLCIGPAVMFISHLNKQYAGGWHQLLKVVMATLEQSLSMTMGWALLYWGYWEFYAAVANQDAPGGRMSQRVIMALVFSAIVFGAILGVDFVADRSTQQLAEGLRGLVKTFALLMGLSWEAAFTEAARSVADRFEGTSRKVVVVGISIGLCAVVLPAWAFFILPKTTQYKHMMDSPRKHSKATKAAESEEPSCGEGAKAPA